MKNLDELEPLFPTHPGSCVVMKLLLAVEAQL